MADGGGGGYSYFIDIGVDLHAEEFNSVMEQIKSHLENPVTLSVGLKFTDFSTKDITLQGVQASLNERLRGLTVNIDAVDLKGDFGKQVAEMRSMLENLWSSVGVNRRTPGLFQKNLAALKGELSDVKRFVATAQKAMDEVHLTVSTSGVNSAATHVAELRENLEAISNKKYVVKLEFATDASILKLIANANAVGAVHIPKTLKPSQRETVSEAFTQVRTGEAPPRHNMEAFFARLEKVLGSDDAGLKTLGKAKRYSADDIVEFAIGKTSSTRRHYGKSLQIAREMGVDTEGFVTESDVASMPDKERRTTMAREMRRLEQAIRARVDEAIRAFPVGGTQEQIKSWAGEWRLPAGRSRGGEFDVGTFTKEQIKSLEVQRRALETKEANLAREQMATAARGAGEGVSVGKKGSSHWKSLVLDSQLVEALGATLREVTTDPKKAASDPKRFITAEAQREAMRVITDKMAPVGGSKSWPAIKEGLAGLDIDRPEDRKKWAEIAHGVFGGMVDWFIGPDKPTPNQMTARKQRFKDNPDVVQRLLDMTIEPERTVVERDENGRPVQRVIPAEYPAWRQRLVDAGDSVGMDLSGKRRAAEEESARLAELQAIEDRKVLEAVRKEAEAAEKSARKRQKKATKGDPEVDEIDRLLNEYHKGGTGGSPFANFTGGITRRAKALLSSGGSPLAKPRGMSLTDINNLPVSHAEYSYDSQGRAIYTLGSGVRVVSNTPVTQRPSQGELKNMGVEDWVSRPMEARDPLNVLRVYTGGKGLIRYAPRDEGDPNIKGYAFGGAVTYAQGDGKQGALPLQGVVVRRGASQVVPMHELTHASLGQTLPYGYASQHFGKGPALPMREGDYSAVAIGRELVTELATWGAAKNYEWQTGKRVDVQSPVTAALYGEGHEDRARALLAKDWERLSKAYPALKNFNPGNDDEVKMFIAALREGRVELGIWSDQLTVSGHKGARSYLENVAKGGKVTQSDIESYLRRGGTVDVGGQQRLLADMVEQRRAMSKTALHVPNILSRRGDFMLGPGGESLATGWDPRAAQWFGQSAVFSGTFRETGGAPFATSPQGVKRVTDGVDATVAKELPRLQFAFRRIMSYAISATMIYGGFRVFAQAGQDIMELDKLSKELNKTLQQEDSTMSSLKFTLVDTAYAYGQTAENAKKAMEQWAKQGFRDDTLKGLTEQALILSNLAGPEMPSDEAARQQTAVLAQFSLDPTVENLTILNDKWQKLSTTQRVSIKDLANGMAKVGALAQNAGYDIDELNATLAATAAVSEDTGENIALAFRSIFSRLNNPNAQVKKAFSGVGINAQDYVGNIPGLMDVIAGKWRGWSPEQKQEVAQAAAEKKRAAVFISYMTARTNPQLYDKAIVDSADSAGASAKANEEIMKSLEKSVMRIKVAWMGFAQQLADTSIAGKSLLDIVTGIAEGFSGALQAYNKMSNIQRVVPNMAMLGFMGYAGVRELGTLGGYAALENSAIGKIPFMSNMLSSAQNRFPEGHLALRTRDNSYNQGVRGIGEILNLNMSSRAAQAIQADASAATADEIDAIATAALLRAGGGGSPFASLPQTDSMNILVQTMRECTAQIVSAIQGTGVGQEFVGGSPFALSAGGRRRVPSAGHEPRPVDPVVMAEINDAFERGRISRNQGKVTRRIMRENSRVVEEESRARLIRAAYTPQGEDSADVARYAAGIRSSQLLYKDNLHRVTQANRNGLPIEGVERSWLGRTIARVFPRATARRDLRGGFGDSVEQRVMVGDEWRGDKDFFPATRIMSRDFQTNNFKGLSGAELAERLRATKLDKHPAVVDAYARTWEYGPEVSLAAEGALALKGKQKIGLSRIGAFMGRPGGSELGARFGSMQSALGARNEEFRNYYSPRAFTRNRMLLTLRNVDKADFDSDEYKEALARTGINRKGKIKKAQSAIDSLVGQLDELEKSGMRGGQVLEGDELEVALAETREKISAAKANFVQQVGNVVTSITDPFKKVKELNTKVATWFKRLTMESVMTSVNTFFVSLSTNVSNWWKSLSFVSKGMIRLAGALAAVAIVAGIFSKLDKNATERIAKVKAEEKKIGDYDSLVKKVKDGDSNNADKRTALLESYKLAAKYPYAAIPPAILNSGDSKAIREAFVKNVEALNLNTDAIRTSLDSQKYRMWFEDIRFGSGYDPKFGGSTFTVTAHDAEEKAARNAAAGKQTINQKRQSVEEGIYLLDKLFVDAESSKYTSKNSAAGGREKFFNELYDSRVRSEATDRVSYKADDGSKYGLSSGFRSFAPHMPGNSKIMPDWIYTELKDAQKAVESSPEGKKLKRGSAEYKQAVIAMLKVQLAATDAAAKAVEDLSEVDVYLDRIQKSLDTLSGKLKSVENWSFTGVEGLGASYAASTMQAGFASTKNQAINNTIAENMYLWESWMKNDFPQLIDGASQRVQPIMEKIFNGEDISIEEWDNLKSNLGTNINDIQQSLSEAFQGLWELYTQHIAAVKEYTQSLAAAAILQRGNSGNNLMWTAFGAAAPGGMGRGVTYRDDQLSAANAAMEQFNRAYGGSENPMDTAAAYSALEVATQYAQQAIQADQQMQQRREELKKKKEQLEDLWLQGMQAFLNFLASTDQANLRQQYLLTERLAKYADTPQEKLEFDQRLFDLRKQVYESRLNGATDWLSHMTALDKVSVPTQIKVWQQVLALAKKTKNKEWIWKAEEEIYRLQKEKAEGIANDLAKSIFKRAAGLGGPLRINAAEFKVAMGDTDSSENDVQDAEGILNEFTKYMRDEFGGMSTDIQGEIDPLWARMKRYADSLKAQQAVQDASTDSTNVMSAATKRVTDRISAAAAAMDNKSKTGLVSAFDKIISKSGLAAVALSTIADQFGLMETTPKTRREKAIEEAKKIKDPHMRAVALRDAQDMPNGSDKFFDTPYWNAYETSNYNSVKKALQDVGYGGGGAGGGGPMSIPVPGGTASSFWGASRGGGTRSHQGVDIMAPMGSPIKAVVGGVANPHTAGLGGNAVTITDAKGNRYYYAHMKNWAVRGGQRVNAGDLIGFVGDSGNAKGGAPHLHFQYHPGGGAAVDPWPFLQSWDSMWKAQHGGGGTVGAGGSHVYPENVNRWRTAVSNEFPANLVDKALWVINYESGGNAAARGDSGKAVGLFQIWNGSAIAGRPSAEWLLNAANNIHYAAKHLGAANGNWGDWGEGRLYNGKPFGSLGNHPYPNYHAGGAVGLSSDEELAVLLKGETVVPRNQSMPFLALMDRISRLDLQNTNNNTVTMPVEINLTMPDGKKVQFQEEVVGISGTKVAIERVLG